MKDQVKSEYAKIDAEVRHLFSSSKAYCYLYLHIYFILDFISFDRDTTIVKKSEIYSLSAIKL